MSDRESWRSSEDNYSDESDSNLVNLYASNKKPAQNHITTYDNNSDRLGNTD